MSEAQLQSAIGKLASEPLFHVSLASRELFHSNFIAWLIERHRSAGSALVGEVFGDPGDPQQLIRVDREVRLPQLLDPSTGKRIKSNEAIDLHIHSFSGNDIWVELKIGAIPSFRQLASYGEKLKQVTDGLPRRRQILMSLRPLAGRMPEEWIGQDVSALAKGMDLAATHVEDPFERGLVEHEATLLRLLVDVGNAVEPSDQPVARWFYSKETTKLLQETRTNTIVAKAKAAGTLNHLRASVPEMNGLDSGAGFTNGSGIVEASRYLADGRSVGWQLQANQFRLFALSAVPKTPLGLTPNELPTWSPSWFDFAPALANMPGLALSSRASGKGVFGESFRYQYLQLPPRVTNAEVLDLLATETARLATL